MTLTRFNFLFILFVILVAAIAQAASYTSKAAILIDGFWVIFGIIAVVTYLAYIFSWMGIKKKGELSVYVILGALTVKLLLAMVLVLVYVSQYKVDSLLFVINFFYLYFSFTAFEVYCLLRNLRHQNRT